MVSAHRLSPIQHSFDRGLKPTAGPGMLASQLPETPSDIHIPSARIAGFPLAAVGCSLSLIHI